MYEILRNTITINIKIKDNKFKFYLYHYSFLILYISSASKKEIFIAGADGSDLGVSSTSWT